MPKIDLASIPPTNRTGYPPPFDAPMDKRWYRRLGPVSGLDDFGVSHVVLRPGGISSQRHWHEGEDEFLVVIAGEAVLIEDEGETVLTAGDCATFPKGIANGHHLVNRSPIDCVFVAIGKPVASDCHYPDVDVRFDGVSGRYVHKDGTGY